MAPSDTAHSKPATAKRSVPFECFDRIGGAARIITARRRQQLSERDLIASHQENEHRTHQEPLVLPAGGRLDSDGRRQCSCAMTRSMSDASSANDAPYASARARMTMSTLRSSGRMRVLESSRSRRFSRFRATADCRCRGTINPTRLPPVASGRTRGEAAARTSSMLVRKRFPSCAIRCRSAPRVIRARRGNACDARGVSGSCVLVRDANRQLLPPLLATASEGLATPFRFHARTNPCVLTRRVLRGR